MPSFSVKQDEDILTITERSFMSFTINEREMEIFAKYQLPSLFKPVLEKSNRIKYTAPSSVPLSGFIRSDMNEHRLFGLLARIMDTVTILEQYELAVSNLVLNENMIFINELTENIFLIYRPFNDGSSGGNIYRFLDNLVLKIRKQNRSISDACDDFHAFLSNPNHYKVSEIVDYINMVYPSIYREIKKPEISDKGDTFRLRNGYEDNSATSFLNTADKQHEENNEHQNKTIFKIISTDNLISFDINKEVYVIGKSKERADGVISGNSMISRIHAEIRITDNHAYIKDLNSANGTFIDGRRLEPDKSEPLYKNSIIKLADMEFIISDTEGFFK